MRLSLCTLALMCPFTMAQAERAALTTSTIDADLHIVSMMAPAVSLGVVADGKSDKKKSDDKRLKRRQRILIALN